MIGRTKASLCISLAAGKSSAKGIREPIIDSDVTIRAKGKRRIKGGNGPGSIPGVVGDNFIRAPETPKIARISP